MSNPDYERLSPEAKELSDWAHAWVMALWAKAERGEHVTDDELVVRTELIGANLALNRAGHESGAGKSAMRRIRMVRDGKFDQGALHPGARKMMLGFAREWLAGVAWIQSVRVA